MAIISETELQKRLRMIEETAASGNKPIVRKVGNTYEYSSDFTYIAYASSISNASTAGVIVNQGDATGFSFSAISEAGEALSWLGYWTSKSLVQSGDPTDYIWTDLTTDLPASSVTLYYTESTELLPDIGNPDFPVLGVTWVSFSGSTPASAFWVATRYTINGSKTPWRIIPIRIKKSNLGLIVYTISGRNKPVLNDAQWKADAITAISISTGETYSTINEMGFGTAISITYDDGKLHGMLKNVNGTPTWVTPVDFLDGDLLVDGTIIAGKIADNAITTAKILDSAIDSDKIAANAVITAKLAENAVTVTQIADDAITTPKIIANAITASEIAAGAVTANEIQAGAIGTLALAANAVTAGKIGANEITATEIAAGTITASEIAAAAITTNELAANAVTADIIAVGAVIADKIASNAITTVKLASESITSEKLVVTGTGAIGAGTIGASTIAANQAAQATADGEIIGFFQDAEPDANSTPVPSFGDIWIDTDKTDPLVASSISRYQDSNGGSQNSLSWVATPTNALGLLYLESYTAQLAADNAASDAADAQEAADGEIIAFFQDAEPSTGMSFGDIWIDTDKSDPLVASSIYRYQNGNGGSSGTLYWNTTPNNALGKLYLESYDAQASADLKIKTFYQTGVPTSLAVGDLWVDTDDNNKLWRAKTVGADENATGTEWASVQDGTISVAQAAANTAATAAATAQTTADGEITGYFQTAAPDANSTPVPSFGDFWIDTDKTNPLTATSISRYEDSSGGSQGTLGWVATPTNALGLLYLESYTAQITANTAVTNAATATTNAATAQTTANTATSTLADIADDDKLTPSEKLQAKTLWDAIVAEKPGIVTSASNASVSSTTYVAKYDALNTYLNTTTTVFASFTATTDITRATWNTVWKEYYEEKQALLDAIAAALKVIADAAQTTATSATSSISDMAADDKLTPMEKLQAKTLWDAVLAEKPGIVTSASNASVSSTTYVAKYDALNTFLNTSPDVFDDMDATTTIVRATWDTRWKEYYEEKQKLLDAIAAALKVIADAGVADAATAQAAATSAATAASNAQGTANTATSTLADIADDDKLTPAEKQQAKTLWDAVATEYSGIISSASNASVSSTAYATAYTNLNTYLNTTPDVFDDMAVTTTIVRTTWDTRWSAYYGAKQALLDAIAAALKIIGDAAQAAADLRITSFYQDGIPTALAIGDLWTDTNDDNKLYRAASIGANEVTSGEWVTVQDEGILAAYNLADSKVLPANVAAAINANETTIAGAKITTGSISAGHIDTVGITASAMNLNGTLDVTADSGAITWGKDDGDDISNTGLFIGRNSSGDPRFIIGNATSFMQFDGTVVSFVGGDIDDSDGTNEVLLTDTSITHRYTIGPNIATINIQMLGAGGGGNRNGTSDWSGPNMEDGGDTIVVIKNSNGVTQTTYTAAGGADGWSEYGGGNYGGGGSPGEAGESFSYPGAPVHSSFAGTGGAGGAGDTNNPGASGSGYGAGGGGQGQAGGGSAAAGGFGGHKGTFYSTTYTVPDTTYYLDITVGVAGRGQGSAGGSGSGGLVRLQGAIA